MVTFVSALQLSLQKNDYKKLELYPDEYKLCGKQRTQHKNKKCTPYIITSVAAVEAIKNAAKLKDNMHYCEIKDVDLIAKEY